MFGVPSYGISFVLLAVMVGSTLTTRPYGNTKTRFDSNGASQRHWHPRQNSRFSSQHEDENDEDDHEASLAEMPFRDVPDKQLKTSRKMACKQYIKELNCIQKGTTPLERDNFCRDKVCYKDLRKDGRCDSRGICCCTLQHIKKKKAWLYDNEDEDEEYDTYSQHRRKQLKRQEKEKENRKHFENNLPFSNADENDD